MGSRIWTGAKKRVEHLQRLAVVFAVPLRLKIVTVLYYREMSPTQFFEEYGGGSSSRVSHSFERLEETFWLRLVRRIGPGGPRRGAAENIYRATELPFFDRETWAALPYSIRVAFSWSAFKTIAEHLRNAIEAKISDDRPGSRLTTMRLTLDLQGRERVFAAVAEEFPTQHEEQEDASRRAEHTGEDLIRAGTVLMAFESPAEIGLRIGPSLIPAKEPLTPFPPRVSKVLEDPICMQIMEEANSGAVSVPQFYREFGDDFDVSEDGVRSRFAKLIDFGWLQEVEQRTGGVRRGGVEKFYRATGPPICDEAEGPWSDLPAAHTNESWRTFQQLSQWIREAMAAGTFDARPDRCLVWSILGLDRQGWDAVIASNKSLLVTLRQEEELAKARLGQTGEAPIVVTVAVGTVESSPELDREI